MNSVLDIEYGLVLTGWVVALLLGLTLLVINAPKTPHQAYYAKGKNTCAISFLIFGTEMFFQWLIRFYLDISDPVLSVSVYLFAFVAATLLLATGFCEMMAPRMMDRRQRLWAVSVLIAYLALLIVNFLFVKGRAQIYGALLCSVLLFLLTCLSIYKCIRIYRIAINNLRTYYSDFVEDLMCWMPGVGVGIMLFLISAPITSFCPRIVGIYQLALGIIMFIYAFVSILNFSFRYSAMAPALHESDAAGHEYNEGVDESGNQPTSLSASLQEIMQDKEQRWREQGGYRTPGLTIEQAARDMGTNRNYLSRYLNQVKQMTFYEWVAQMRIEEAQTLMAGNDGSMTMEQIAAQVGFSSYPTFSSTFKKMVGITPNRWRSSQ